MLGNTPLKEFLRKVLHHHVALRNKQAQPATVNRGTTAISKLFFHALECGAVDTHPLVWFPKLKEAKKIFRPLTVQQFRDLVDAVDNRYLQAMVAVIVETGIPNGEALSLTWHGRIWFANYSGWNSPRTASRERFRSRSTLPDACRGSPGT